MLRNNPKSLPASTAHRVYIVNAKSRWILVQVMLVLWCELARDPRFVTIMVNFAAPGAP